MRAAQLAALLASFPSFVLVLRRRSAVVLRLSLRRLLLPAAALEFLVSRLLFLSRLRAFPLLAPTLLLALLALLLFRALALPLLAPRIVECFSLLPLGPLPIELFAHFPLPLFRALPVPLLLASLTFLSFSLVVLMVANFTLALFCALATLPFAHIPLSLFASCSIGVALTLYLIPNLALSLFGLYSIGVALTALLFADLSVSLFGTLLVQLISDVTLSSIRLTFAPFALTIQLLANFFLLPRSLIPIPNPLSIPGFEDHTLALIGPLLIPVACALLLFANFSLLFFRLLAVPFARPLLLFLLESLPASDSFAIFPILLAYAFEIHPSLIAAKRCKKTFRIGLFANGPSFNSYARGCTRGEVIL